MTSDRGGYHPPPGFPGSPQRPATPKAKSPWPWIIGISAAAVVIVVIVSTVTVVTSRRDGGAEAQQATVVTYELTGSAGSVELVYWGSTGQKRSETATLPWRNEVTVSGADAYVSISAQTADGSDQDLSCRITANGRTVVEDATVSGSVACNGRLDES